MTATVSCAPHQAISPASPHHGDVLRCVRQQERIEAIVPKGVTAVIFGGTTGYFLLRAGGLTGGVLIGAALAFFAAGIVNNAIRLVILQPSRRIRFGSAAKKLCTRIASAGDLSMPPMSWFTGSPGALGVTRDGHLVVAARGTDYEQLRLSLRQIADVRVERDVEHVTTTRHSGRTVFGAVGGGLMGAHVSGGRSTSITRAVENLFLELAYQLEPNGPVGIIVVPFGADRCQAEATAALIRRLHGQS